MAQAIVLAADEFSIGKHRELKRARRRSEKNDPDDGDGKGTIEI
jgi:hypothetical protein